MKNLVQRFTAAALVGGLLMFTAGCGADDSGADDSGAAGDGDGSYQIGIGQYVAHPALDASREGFKAAFKEAGLEVEFEEQTAAADQATVNNIFGSFAQDSDIDLVFAIATPAAITAASNISDKPILFGAVTDPVTANLVESWEAPGGNVTGVSDMNPVAEQLEMIREFMPEATRLGIPYASAEANSAVQVEVAREVGAELGFEIEEATVTNSSEVQQAVASLAGVDVIWVPTDNVVVSTLETVLSFGIDNQVPVFAGEPEPVRRGAVATFGIDYFEQGKRAGEMAIDILENGTDPGQIPVEQARPEDLQRTINTTAAEQMGLSLTEEQLADAELVD